MNSWINGEMTVLRRNFMPEDLLPVYKENNIDGCVLVQVDQSEEENDFQLNNAIQNDFIKGVVGWIDLQATNIDERLNYYSQQKLMKGFRHILQSEPQRDFMLRKDFKRGVGVLKKYNFTYDILIYPDQLQYIPEFISDFPDQPFIIDHIAKPNIKERKIEDWKKEIQKVAKHDNVSCKISGMITEADWKNWKPSDFTPYLDVIVECFGIKRIMFGSDWPVCLVAGTYEKVLNVVKEYFSEFSKDEQKMFFGENAIRFYNLDMK